MFVTSDPGPWQYYSKRVDNVGLSPEVLRQKYLTESFAYQQQMMLAQAQSIGNGSGASSQGSTVSPDGSGTIVFNGTNSYVQVPNITMKDWLPGTGDFTVEWFFKQTGDGTGAPRVWSIDLDTAATMGVSIESGLLYVWAYGTQHSTSPWIGGSQMPQKYLDGDWCHVAISRSSGTTRLYLDGTYIKKVSTTRLIDDTIHAGSPMYMGGDGSTNWWQGNITNFRWDNSAVYTSETTITVPTSPLKALTNTKLLLLGGSITNPVYDATKINTLVDSNTSWSPSTPF